IDTVKKARVIQPYAYFFMARSNLCARHKIWRTATFRRSGFCPDLDTPERCDASPASKAPTCFEETTMAEKTLQTLFHDTLRDIYYAERKILKSLPKMARAAQSPELKAAFEKHREQTEGQIERLQQVLEIIGKPARRKTCDAIEGILAEGDEIAEEYKDTAALDAGLLAAAQAVEHYEITRYGTLKRWAEVMGLKDAVKLLDETLQEESQTD